MKISFKNKKILWVAFFGLQILGVNILKRYPECVEQFYSKHIFVFISKLMRYVTGWLPFSFGDILYAVVIVLALVWLVKNRKRIVNDTLSWLLDIVKVVSIAYFLFHVLWAYNYYRQPMYKTLNIEPDYTTEELVVFTEQLIEKSNTIHSQLSDGNDSLKIVFPYSKAEIFDKVVDGYTELSVEYPDLEYHPESMKASLFSLPLTYMGFSGYLNPFTIEAQVNDKIPTYKLPTTACHEAAHQLGFAAENEANFVGCLSAIHNPDIYFKYSGYTFILKYCLFKIASKDEQMYEALLKEINPGILRNYYEVQEFWMSYQNPMESVLETTYDSFLKANNQSGGMQSYGYVVALMVNYYKNNTL